ncbi:MAG: PHP domain-containing protein [Steroidobacteraceae bacterium]
MIDPVIDLHTHSNCSDGSLRPDELVRRAHAAGVHVLALTDHDTVAGLEVARHEAQLVNITFVPGVEISASWRSQAVHVLGLWIDPESRELGQHLAAQIERRRERMRIICSRLNKLHLPGDALLALVEAQPGVPTRAHLAEAMRAGGHVKSTDDAFRKYLGKGKSAHLAAAWPALAEVIAWITGSGGVASLAHPSRYALSAGARRRLVEDFASAGGGALEVVSGANGKQDADASGILAMACGLAGSVGSDFHSPLQTWNPLGRLAKLPSGVTPVWRAFGL